MYRMTVLGLCVNEERPSVTQKKKGECLPSCRWKQEQILGDRKEMNSDWNMLIFVELKCWLMHPLKKDICGIYFKRYI